MGTIGSTTGYRFKVHPAAEVFELLGVEKFNELVESIEKNGLLHEPTVTRDNVLLDGRNRVLACEAAGVKIGTPKIFGGGVVAQVDYIVASNIDRRMLTLAERKKAGVALVPLYEKAIKEEQAARGAASSGRAGVASKRVDSGESSRSGGKATARAGKAVGVSRETVARGVAEKKTEEVRAVAPEIAAAVDDKRITPTTAKAIVATQQAVPVPKSGPLKPFLDDLKVRGKVDPVAVGIAWDVATEGGTVKKPTMQAVSRAVHDVKKSEREKRAKNSTIRRTLPEPTDTIPDGGDILEIIAIGTRAVELAAQFQKAVTRHKALSSSDRAKYAHSINTVIAAWEKAQTAIAVNPNQAALGAGH